MAEFVEPLVCSTPGTLAERYIPIDLGDALDELDTVDGGGSNLAGVTVTAEISDVDAVWNEETFAAERTVKLSVAVAAGLEDQDGYIYFHVVSLNGEDFWLKKELFVRQYISADQPARPLES